MFELSSSSASKGREAAFMADTDQESAPLVENRLVFDISEEEFEPGLECFIYKVPKHLREVKENAFTPQLISIGPVHYGNSNLTKMERQKLRYLRKFCQRISQERFEVFRSFIKENIQRIRGCYDEFVLETELKASEFVTMILNDAVFIIELFLRHSYKEDDFLLKKESFSHELWIDLMLLENQLPFFVLEHLCHLASSVDGRVPLVRLALEYFGFFDGLWCVLFDAADFRHLTDFFLYSSGRYHLSITQEGIVINYPSNSDERIDRVYSATMLHEAGVDFKAVQHPLWPLDLQFGKGKLRIPTLQVAHRTEAIIRNLMAWEQCHYPEEAYFCSYIELLDQLVDTDKDVDLLVKKGIFVNLMGSNAELAGMINTLMVGIARARLPPCYGKMGKDLIQYYHSSWNRTKATLRHVYFSNLWRGTATVAAVIVVLLTLSQTVLAILDRAMPT